MTVAVVLAALALVAAAIACALAVGAHARLTRLRREVHRMPGAHRPEPVQPVAVAAAPDTAALDDLRSELASVRADLAAARADLTARTQDAPAGLDALRRDLETTRSDLARSLRNVAVVRYDAFGDMGGRLSFSAALVDDVGDGIVISSIHARAESRTYAKGVVGGASDVVLTPEEQEALAAARSGETVR